jgi:RNA polymerase sigma factor (sigma-70 family)
MTNEQVTSDSEIIDEIINGKKEMYELLIRKYNQRLYRVAKGILWEEADIEDAIQDAYIKAYKNLSQFEKRSTFSTWITRILINECLIRQKALRRNPLPEISDENKILEQIAATFNPEMKMINNELKVMLEKAISLLPEKYRVVFVMREIENMSVADTTSALEITETNVKARLSRAKEMLRNQLMSSYPMSELLDFNLTRCDRIVMNVMSRI